MLFCLRGFYWLCLRYFKYYNEMMIIIDCKILIKNILKISVGGGKKLIKRFKRSIRNRKLFCNYYSNNLSKRYL